MSKNKGQFGKGQHWRSPQRWWNREWLYDQYVHCCRSAREIATECGIGETGILYWLAKLEIPRRSTSETRKQKHWGAVGSDNPMWNRYGELNPNWRGGVTPERQGFYVSTEWRAACAAVWKRDGAICRRCGLHKDDAGDMPFHIHHIISFANADLRADCDNLVLLCEACHQFVHSKRNTGREHLPKA